MRVPAILFAALVIAGAVSCSKKEDKGPKPNVVTAVPVVSGDEKLALQAAEKLTEQYSTELQKALTDAVSETGPAGAIQVCGEKAASISKSMYGGGCSVMRVTQRYRNPDNKADTLQAQILAQFERDTTKKFQSTWEAVGSGRVYTYCKPIYVNDLCVNCHGDAQSMDPKVVSALADKYPTDQALGYKTGDLRGMLVVTEFWPVFKTKAQQIVQP